MLSCHLICGTNLAILYCDIDDKAIFYMEDNMVMFRTITRSYVSVKSIKYQFIYSIKK